MNALAKTQQTYSLAPTNFAELERFADKIARSSFVPDAFRGKPGDVMAAVQLGAEVGLAPMNALQNIAVIKGKPSVYGDAALAICQNHPLWVTHKETEGPGWAECTVTRRGDEPHTVRYTVEDAKTAGLWGKDTWAKHPKRMLQMRARGFALRDKFADALKGMITREEAEDYPDPVRATVVDVSRDKTPAESEAIGARIDAAEKAYGKRSPLPDGVDPIHAQLQREMDGPRVVGDPSKYRIKRGKNGPTEDRLGKELGELSSDSLSWYAANSRDPEEKMYAQAELEARIERETSANQQALDAETAGDAWGLASETEDVPHG